MNKRIIQQIEEDPDTGEAILTFPDDMMEELGWQEGDETQAYAARLNKETRLL